MLLAQVITIGVHDCEIDTCVGKFTRLIDKIARYSWRIESANPVIDHSCGVRKWLLSLISQGRKKAECLQAYLRFPYKIGTVELYRLLIYFLSLL